MANKNTGVNSVSNNSINEIDCTQSQDWQQKTFKERLDEIPVYTTTQTQLSNIYLSIKGRNETLKKTFNIGEYIVNAFAETATPVVVGAINSAIATAKPLIGEVTLDSIASETLAKVEEKFPVIKKTPSEIAVSTKEVIKNTTSCCLEILKDTAAAKTVCRQANSVAEMSYATVGIAEMYYASLTSNIPRNILDVADKTVTFVMVPTRVVSEYILSCQWINIPYAMVERYAVLKSHIPWDALDVVDKAVTFVIVPTRVLSEYIMSSQWISIPKSMTEKCYAVLKCNVPVHFLDVTEQAVTVVMVPTQVVSQYVLSSRLVRWISNPSTPDNERSRELPLRASSCPNVLQPFISSGSNENMVMA